MDALFIPTLSFWTNQNSWYGSLGSARFYIQPIFPEAGSDAPPQLQVKLWRGPLTLELSQILETVSFPLTEDAQGLPALSLWLEHQAQALNSDP